MEIPIWRTISFHIILSKFSVRKKLGRGHTHTSRTHAFISVIRKRGYLKAEVRPAKEQYIAGTRCFVKQRRSRRRRGSTFFDACRNFVECEPLEEVMLASSEGVRVSCPYQRCFRRSAERTRRRRVSEWPLERSARGVRVRPRRSARFVDGQSDTHSGVSSFAFAGAPIASRSGRIAHQKAHGRRASHSRSARSPQPPLMAMAT